MAKKIEPPESTKRVADCLFRLKDGICCNAKNYLRPHHCNGYCVEKLDRWFRDSYPEMDDAEIRSHVAILTEDEEAK